MAKRVDFSLDFSLDFSTTHISATRVSEKYLPSQIFDRSKRRYCACFRSTCSTRWPNGSIFTQQQLFSSIFFDKDQTSLNITRLHSTHSTRWPNGSIFSSIFCRVKNRVKNRVVWPGPKARSGPYLQGGVEGVSHPPGTIPVSTGPNLAFLSANKQTCHLRR